MAASRVMGTGVPQWSSDEAANLRRAKVPTVSLIYSSTLSVKAETVGIQPRMPWSSVAATKEIRQPRITLIALMKLT